MTTLCPTCHRDPKNVNNDHSECSVVDCPSRRRAWSERPTPRRFFRGPWSKSDEGRVKPIDKELK